MHCTLHKNTPLWKNELKYNHWNDVIRNYNKSYCVIAIIMANCLLHNNLWIISVATLAFGLRLRQGGWEVAGLEVDPRVTSHAPGSAKSVREWTLTLPSELPCWELVRVGVPKGLPKLQRAFWGVKTPWIVALLISMESSWSVDV